VIDKVRNERKGVVILDSHCIEGVIICNQPSFFLMKKMGEAIADLEGWMQPVWRFLRIIHQVPSAH